MLVVFAWWCEPHATTIPQQKGKKSIGHFSFSQLRGLLKKSTPQKSTYPPGNGYISHRKGKGKSSTQNAIFWGKGVSSLEGKQITFSMVNHLAPQKPRPHQVAVARGDLQHQGRIGSRRKRAGRASILYKLYARYPISCFNCMIFTKSFHGKLFFI